MSGSGVAHSPFSPRNVIIMLDFGNRLRYSQKARYPVNQLQMSRTDTTDYEGERQPVGYGEGTSDPHQGGFQGEMSSNMSDKRPKKRNNHFLGHGLGVSSY